MELAAPTKLITFWYQLFVIAFLCFSSYEDEDDDSDDDSDDDDNEDDSSGSSSSFYRSKGYSHSV